MTTVIHRPGPVAKPGGSNCHIQYNNAGLLGGGDNCTWDETNKKQKVLGDIEQIGGEAGNLYNPVVVSTTVVGAAPRNSTVQANYLYVVDSTEFSLRIYDFTDPTAPALISTTLGFGKARGVAIEGRHVYVNDANGNLFIVDVLDKSAPVIVGTLNHGNTGRGVRVSGKICFITNNTAAKGLQAIDVSDPTAPVLLSSYNTSFNARTEFDVNGTIVYVGNGASSSNFHIVDVSDPTNMVTLVTLDIVANAPYWACKVQGRYAYMVGESGLLIFDVSDPAATSTIPVGSFDPGGISSLRAVDVAGNFVYMVDAGLNTVQCVDVSDPTNPVAISNAFTIGQNPVSISVSGRFAFITDNNDDDFRVIDFKGIDAQAINVGSIDVGQVNVRRDVKLGNNISVGLGIVVGPGGINSDGEIASNGRKLGRKYVATAVAVQTNARGDVIVGVTNTVAPRTITISTTDIVNMSGNIITVKDQSGAAATNNITVATEGAETIDGQATVVINTNYGYVILYSDGANLFVIG